MTVARLGWVGVFLLGCGAKVVFDAEENVGGAGGSGGSGDAGGAAAGAPPVTGGSIAGGGAPTGGAGGSGPTGLAEEVVIEDSTGSSISIDVPSGTLGITAIANASDPFSPIAFSRLTSPSGATANTGSLASNGYEWAFYGDLSMAAPQFDHPETFPLAEGPWAFEFESDSPARVSIWRRFTSDGEFHGGVIDVNLFIAGGATTETYAAETLAQAYDDLGGLELGDVAFYELGDEYFVVDENNLFALAAETASAERRPAVNIMAVGAITGQFEGAAGFVLGIPGAPTAPGANTSMLVWGVTDSGFDPLILRHETGHFGGLFHTTEFQPGLGDPLDDTPQCEDVINLFSDCPDYSFTMFPTGGDGEGLFSEKEERVLQGSTLYRGIFSAGGSPSPPAPSGPQGAITGKPLAPSVAEALGSPPTARPIPLATWGGSLSLAEVEILQGIGCPSGHDYFEDLGRVGTSGASAYLAIAKDTNAPAYIRRRAGVMAERLLPNDPQLRAELDALRTDPSSPRVLRARTRGH